MEPFQPTYSPARAVLSANVSSRLAFGLRLPCPKEHGYRVDYLSTYIMSKLDPDGKGGGTLSGLVFPIRCPECRNEWSGIKDTVAER